MTFSVYAKSPVSHEIKLGPSFFINHSLYKKLQFFKHFVFFYYWALKN